MQKHYFDRDMAARYGMDEADMLAWFACVLDGGTASDADEAIAFDIAAQTLIR